MAAVVAGGAVAFKAGAAGVDRRRRVRHRHDAVSALRSTPPQLPASEIYVPTAGRRLDRLGANADQPQPRRTGTPQVDADEKEDDLPLDVILDENGADHGSILAGRMLKTNKAVTLDKNVLKRHAAVLGGSGSGKTTLALNLIEQVLQKGIPAILIDRKGDLCSYANPDVWRAIDGDYSDRRGEREKLADQIDVAVYTPGRSSGRPISITLLPNGIKELPEHEQQLLANLSAAALGDMLHLKNSATHQKHSGTLSVALKLLGQRFSTQVMLADLIHLLEEDDPELADATQRMDPSGKLRRDLVAQLDSLRQRNASLFEAGGEMLYDGTPARPRPPSPTGRPHAAVDHLHRLPRRQREHPVLGVAVPLRGAALLPAQPERRAAGAADARRGRSLHSGQRQSPPPPSRCKAC